MITGWFDILSLITFNPIGILGLLLVIIGEGGDNPVKRVVRFWFLGAFAVGVASSFGLLMKGREVEGEPIVIPLGVEHEPTIIIAVICAAIIGIVIWWLGRRESEDG